MNSNAQNYKCNIVITRLNDIQWNRISTPIVGNTDVWFLNSFRRANRRRPTVRLVLRLRADIWIWIEAATELRRSFSRSPGDGACIYVPRPVIFIFIFSLSRNWFSCYSTPPPANPTKKRGGSRATFTWCHGMEINARYTLTLYRWPCPNIILAKFARKIRSSSERWWLVGWCQHCCVIF